MLKVFQALRRGEIRVSNQMLGTHASDAELQLHTKHVWSRWNSEPSSGHEKASAETNGTRQTVIDINREGFRKL